MPSAFKQRSIALSLLVAAMLAAHFVFPAGLEAQTPCSTISCSASAPGTATVGSPVGFSGSGAGVPAGCATSFTYTWNFGDATSSTAQSTSKTYSAAGTYNWSLLVKSGAFTCSRTGAITVSAPAPACMLSCSASAPATGTTGSAISFSSASSSSGSCTGTATYSWNFGDGATSSSANATHTYASEGTYSWVVTVIRGSVQCRRSGTIVINKSCALDCSATVPAMAIKGVATTFSASATPTNCGTPPTYQWSFGDGSTSTEQSPQKVYNAEGSFNWTLTATAAGVNCMKSGSIAVGPAPPAITLFAPNPTTITEGMSAVLSWTTTGATSVIIDHGIGRQDSSGSLSITPAATTTFTLTAIGPGGSTTRTTTITVVPPPALVVVPQLPEPLLQIEGSAPASSSFRLKNAGGLPTTVTLVREGEFFTQSPTTFFLPPGGDQLITLVATARARGEYRGASIPIGEGVAAGFSVPIRLLVAPRPNGTVVPVPEQNRVDVSAPSDQRIVTGSVNFTNLGTGLLTGVAVADVLWIIPQEGVVTIAPGATAPVSFTIDRSKRPDAAAPLGTVVGNLRLVPIATDSSSGAGGADLNPRITSPSGTTPGGTVPTSDTAHPAAAATAVPALGAGERAIFVSGIGNVASSVGRFISDLTLVNQTDLLRLRDVRIFFTEAATSGNGQAISVTIPMIPTRQPIGFSDVVLSVFKRSGQTGTLQLRSGDLDKLTATASVVTTSNPRGTFGTAIPSLRSDRGVPAGEAMFMTGLLSDPATSHTNFILQEVAGAPVTLSIDFYAANGTAAGGRRIEALNPFQLLRLDRVVPEGAISAVLRSEGGSAGKFLGFATPVDRAREPDGTLKGGDTWVVSDWSRLLGYSQSEPVVVPVAGGVRGTNNLFFRTDLSIMNSGLQQGGGVLRFIPEAGTHIERTVTLAPLHSANYRDVMSTLFGMTSRSLGYLLFIPDPGMKVVLTSRTYATQGADVATFGTGVPTLAASASLKAGQARRIGGLVDTTRENVAAGKPATFRTNFALLETSGQAATVRLTLHYSYAAGHLAAVLASERRDYELAPWQFRLITNIATEFLGESRAKFGELRNLQLDVEVIGGAGAVTAFTTSIDNGTGDQIMKVE